MDLPEWDQLDRATRWRAVVGFTRRAIPELRGMPTARAKKLYHAALWRAWRTGRMWWPMGLFFAGLCGATWVQGRLVGSMGWWSVPALAAVMVVLWGVLNLAAFGAIRRCVRAELGRHCPECDYDLRGSEGRCPECGARSGGGDARVEADADALRPRQFIDSLEDRQMLS